MDVKNNVGWTALITASRDGHKAVVELLIVNGAVVNIRDKDVHTVLDAIKGRPEMLELIETHGTKRQ